MKTGVWISVEPGDFSLFVHCSLSVADFAAAQLSHNLERVVTLLKCRANCNWSSRRACKESHREGKCVTKL